MLVLLTVPFQGMENITVQKRIDFVLLFRIFRCVSGQWPLVVVREAGLFVE